ncbi:MAG: ATP-binding cassette domain-containing protein [Candidatus Pacearchaeota archaeon]|jgi:ABC-type polysaccharide/polyol phosphate transport system ATPase subunit
MSNNKLILENVNKKFRLKPRKRESALNYFRNFFNKKEKYREILVLNDINLTLDSGEILGIIGKNGSGKSTLLRAIAGIYDIDSGIIKINGKTSYLSGFGIGFQERLTMRDNIYLVGYLLNLSKSKIKSRFNEIVDFSGLNDYVDIPLFKFSNGMKARLAFSTTVHCLYETNSDILLLDEVFGTWGDQEYKLKGISKMNELTKSGSSIIIVTHDLDVIRDYCHKVIWIENGKIIDFGDSKEIVKRYLDSFSKI